MPDRAHRLRSTWTWALSVAVFLLAVVSFGGEAAGLGSAFANLDWQLLPYIFGLTAINYVVRAWRWHLLLRRISNEPSLTRSSLVFFAGNVMILTPARMGEFIKSYYLNLLYRIPVASTAPIVIVERVSDGVAMLALASTGMIFLGTGWAIAIPIGITLAMLYWVLSNPMMLRAVAGLLWRLSLTRRWARPVLRFRSGSQTVLSRRGFLQSFAVGALAWGIECVTYFLVLISVGATPTPLLLLQATTIFPLGTLVGTFSFLPAGLGAAEASIAGLTILVVGLSVGSALAAALVIRVTILGFGLIAGLIAASIIGKLGFRLPQG